MEVVAVDTPATEALAVAMEKLKRRADAAGAARDCGCDNGAGAGCGSRDGSDMIQKRERQDLKDHHKIANFCQMLTGF